MLRIVLLFNLILCPFVICKRRQHKDKYSYTSNGDFGRNLVSNLRNDTNIDLSADEEYKELRAELLAYHAALASITSSRRSMKTTPCWRLGGICIEKKMCEGHRFLAQVAGCRDKLEICCFTWNNFYVRDMRDKGLGLAMPWPQSTDFGGKGVIDPPTYGGKKKKKRQKVRKILHDEDFYEGTHDNSRMKFERYDKSYEKPPNIVIIIRK